MKLKDIAQICQTSVATVSRVINNDPNVADSTRKKVLDVIEQYGFVPNSTGRNLRTQRSNKILVLVPTMSNQFYSRIIQGIESKAEDVGYNILVAFTNLETSTELKYLDMLPMKQVDGCISFFNTIGADKVTELATKYPFVQCSEPTVGADTSSVVVDNKQAIYEATEYFIEQGHKRIAMISGDYYKYSEMSRESGYKQALSDHQIAFDDTLLLKTFYRYKDGAEAINTFMKLDNPPTAVICVSDSLAIGAINELNKQGKQVGKDICVIGFDDTSINSHYQPTISSIKQPRFELGQEAFDLMYAKLQDNNTMNKKVILQHQIIHRESTGCKK